MIGQHSFSDSVLCVLKDCQADGAVIRLPARQLDRALYMDVAKVLEALGGKWNRKAKGILFKKPAAEVLAGLLEGDQTYVNKQQANGFFETPAALAARMRAMARIQPTDRVLEPSAGRGRLLIGIRGDTRMTAVEVDPENAAELARLAERRPVELFAKRRPAGGDRLPALDLCERPRQRRVSGLVLKYRRHLGAVA